MGNPREKQEKFLKTLVQERISTSIYLVNGIKLQGIIVAYDQDVFFLKNISTQMICRSAISTIAPSRDVFL